MAVNNNADDYANARLGIFFPGFPPSLTGQCVSLVKWFIGEMAGVSNWQAARGHAKDFGDTLVRQGLAVAVGAAQYQRGDIVVWKADGGGYGHIGIVLSGDRVFEENIGLAGTASTVVSGVRVYASRISPLFAAWRKGSATFYRLKGYREAVPTPAPAPQPAPASAPASSPEFAVGDLVVPTRLVDYSGVHLKQYDPNYIITQIRGKRAVLSARGQVWAAMNTADIRKV